MSSTIRNTLWGMIAVSILAGGVGLCEPAPARISYSQDSSDLWQRIQGSIQAGDPHAVVEIMTSQGAPRVVAGLYESVVQDLYYEARDLRAVILVAQKGIDYCLSQATEAAGRQDANLANALRGQAKVLAYNLGAHTWPGWDDPGIDPRPEDRAAGVAAAQLNLRLGEELGRGPEPMSTAHWLLGAHALAAARYADAMDYFRESADLARLAQVRSLELLADGYAAITILASTTAIDDGQEQWRQTRDAFRSENVAEAEFWLDQLATAYRVFVDE